MKDLTLFLSLAFLATQCLGMGSVRTFVGEAPNDQFGISVGSCDLNDDGWIDIAVGANTNDAGGSAAGRVYIFMGGDGDTIADLTLTGPVAGGHLGWSLGDAGDVNRDGYDDFVVGAHFTSDLNTRSGRAYLYLGSDSPDADFDVAFAETLYDARLGYAVSGGDFNGDGYSDIAIGAPNAHGKGLVRIYLGAEPPDSICDFTVHGEAAYDLFGSAVCLGGDLNGDTYTDLVVGAHGYNRGGDFNVGRVYVFFGGSSPDTVCDLVLDGEYRNDYFGAAVSADADLDLDGFDDLCIGSYGSDSGDSTEVGKCFVFSGSASPDSLPDMVLWSGAAHNENFGISVAVSPPDGTSPAVVLGGADGNDDEGTDAGMVYTFTGPQPEGGAPDDGAPGEGAGSSFGHSTHLVQHFLASEPRVLALSGGYGEGTTGKARLLTMDLSAASPQSPVRSRLRLCGNPFVRDEPVMFLGPKGLRGARLTVTDVRGRILLSEPWPSTGRLAWNGKTAGDAHLAPGLYFCTLDPGSGPTKMLILR
jgi:hypothetical protein